MYVLTIYDVSVERVNDVRKFLKQRLDWIQNSAFEGELSEGQLVEMKMGLRELINKKSDSVIIFIAAYKGALSKEVLGIEKNVPTNVI